MNAKLVFFTVVISALVSLTVSLVVREIPVSHIAEEQPRQLISNSSQMNDQIPLECFNDLQKYCADKNSVQEKDACLQDHFEKIEIKACYEKLKIVRDSFEPCEQDLKKHCDSVGFGGGRIINCLRNNLAQLTVKCKKRVGK